MTAQEVDHALDRLYARTAPEAEVEVLDVHTGEVHRLAPRRLIEVLRPEGGFGQSEDGEPRPSPVIVSVPHAGVLIPTRFAARFPRDERHLVEIDLFSHLLYEQVTGTRLVCRLAPTFVDMNRSRVAAEEAHVPGHLRNPPHEYYTVEDEPILSRPYTPDEEEDVLRWYDLYHGLLDALLRGARRRHGWALLIDGHSMTSVGLGRVHDEGEGRDSFVVGTLHGTSADDAIIDAFVGTLRDAAGSVGLALSVAENDPYSGGFITRSHYDPQAEVHALQVEVTMDSYMYEADDPEPARRYMIKQHRLDVVRRVLARAVAAAADAGQARHR